MARYIDADNFRKNMIKRFGCIPCLTDYSEASRNDIPIDDALNLATTADVAPRAELAREIFEEIEEHLRGIFDFFRQDNDIRESCAIMFALSEITKLKKKYTGDAP